MEFQSFQNNSLSNFTSILTQTNHMLVKAKLNTATAMNFFFATVFLTLLLLIFISITSHSVSSFLDRPYSRILTSNIILLTYTLVYVIMIYRSHFPLSFKGITLNHWRKDIKITLILTIGFLIALLISKLIYIKLTNNTQMHVFDFPAKKSPISHSVIMVLFYTAFTAVQEFTSRGVIQGITMTLANNLYERIRAILIVTMIFCCTH